MREDAGEPAEPSAEGSVVTGAFDEASTGPGTAESGRTGARTSFPASQDRSLKDVVRLHLSA
ncbi:hypothetical protein BJM39_27540 [Salmonella enterica subsp. enterica serovar Javiana]|nr:hypothetical protein BJM39_27540 [Salmonella enterica subsp. enterica serovar Javiana]